MSSHAHPGVQRGIGVLEDHLDRALRLDRGGVARAGGDVLAVEADDALVGPVEAGDQAGDGGFARAALADQAEGLAPLDDEGDVVDGLEHPAVAFEDRFLQDEGEVEVFDLDGAFRGALFAGGAQPVGLDVDAAGVGLSAFDVVDRGEAFELLVGAGDGGDQGLGCTRGWDRRGSGRRGRFQPPRRGT